MPAAQEHSLPAYSHVIVIIRDVSKLLFLEVFLFVFVPIVVVFVPIVVFFLILVVVLVPIVVFGFFVGLPQGPDELGVTVE